MTHRKKLIEVIFPRIGNTEYDATLLEILD